MSADFSETTLDEIELNPAELLTRGIGAARHRMRSEFSEWKSANREALQAYTDKTLARLDPEQRLIATSTNTPGWHVTIANAGTGKSTTLLARAVHQINGDLTPADLTLTVFNNHAARELRERWSKSWTQEFGSVSPAFIPRITTLHALASNLARALHGGLVVQDEEAGQLLWHQLLLREDPECNRSTANAVYEGIASLTRRNEIQKVTGTIKPGFIRVWPENTNYMILEETAHRAGLNSHQLANAIRVYTEMLDKTQSVDIDALPHHAATLLQNTPLPTALEILDLGVDESQDIDPSQYALIEAIGAPTTVLVGDPKQTLYVWRDSSPELMSQGDSQRYYLTHNYRSHAHIIRLTNLLHNQFATPAGRPSIATPKPHLPVNAKIKVLNFKSVDEERQEIANLVRQILATNPEDTVGILTYTNKQISAFEPKLMARRIPYRIKQDRVTIQQRPMVVILRELAHLATSTEHASAWLLLLSKAHGIGAGTIASLTHAMVSTNPTEVLTEPPVKNSRTVGIIKESSTRILMVVQAWIKHLADTPTDELMNRLVETAINADLIDRGESTKDLTNVLQEALNETLSDEPLLTPLQALNQITSYTQEVEDGPTESKLEQIPRYKKRTTLTTIHGAKGMEFDHVILTHQQARRGSARHIDEDVCLLYTALTRAKKTIHMSLSELDEYTRQPAEPNPVLLRLIAHRQAQQRQESQP